jgi:hypothetical protein
MDLKSELLQVLDDPSRVWESVLANLAPEPRISILVFTTCPTPISIVHWQEAIARVSPQAAVVFEASLKTLDDSFVSISRPDSPIRSETSWMADFRNPTMDDFCSGYLDRNVGVVVDIATKLPVFRQAQRIAELGIAYVPVDLNSSAPRPRRHPNIYESLIADPTILLNRFLDLMPEEDQLTGSVGDLIPTILNLMSHARVIRDEDFGKVRDRVRPVLDQLSFGARFNSLLYRLLDVSPVAVQLAKILGPDLERFCRKIAESAFALDHFDSLVNFDTALGRSSEHAFWADQFFEQTDDWLSESTGSEGIEADREIYSKVISHLDLSLSGFDRESEWDIKYEAAIEAESHDDPENEDNSVLNDDRDSYSQTGFYENRAINDMFSGLRDAIR